MSEIKFTDKVTPGAKARSIKQRETFRLRNPKGSTSTTHPLMRLDHGSVLSTKFHPEDNVIALNLANGTLICISEETAVDRIELTCEIGYKGAQG